MAWAGHRAWISFILQMDIARSSHRPVDLPKLLSHGRAGSPDLVIGSRWVRGGQVNGWSARKRVALSKADIIMSVLSGGHRTRATAGLPDTPFVFLDTHGIRRARETTGFGFQVEMTGSSALGATIVECRSPLMSAWRAIEARLVDFRRGAGDGHKGGPEPRVRPLAFSCFAGDLAVEPLGGCGGGRSVARSRRSRVLMERRSTASQCVR